MLDIPSRGLCGYNLSPVESRVHVYPHACTCTCKSRKSNYKVIMNVNKLYTKLHNTWYLATCTCTCTCTYNKTLLIVKCYSYIVDTVYSNYIISHLKIRQENYKLL